MGDDDDVIEWYEPVFRGIFPLDQFHVSRSTRRLLNRTPFHVEVDQRFTEVVLACGSDAAGRDGTWITAPIIEAYSRLQAQGNAHSIEVMDGTRLVGGLYGVRLGSAFFGESMFSYVTGGSKIALVHTAARLQTAGFQLFDVQYQTEHLRSFGCVEISRGKYRHLLRSALHEERRFPNSLSATQLADFVAESH
ncbi:UNVERIFIED_CONTAM: hypothetical protein GTU68_033546 [Idotea baltica]|nr:hypothetical protein [Idotea baltica]